MDKRKSIRKSVLLTGIALLLAGCMNPDTYRPTHREVGDRVVVVSDMGGYIGERHNQIRLMSAQGKRVEIRGTCASACTMFLAMPDVCVAPDAKIGFHGPSYSGRPLKQPAFDSASRIMSAGYPEPLKVWFMEEGRHRIRGFRNFSGRELIEMGVRAC